MHRAAGDRTRTPGAARRLPGGAGGARPAATRARPHRTTARGSTASPRPRCSPPRPPPRTRTAPPPPRITGALLHDIGKLEAYTTDPLAIELTDNGRLQGEIPLGYYRVRRTIEQIEGFPRATAQALLHIILSHHGTLEHGSPVVPATREATLVHFLDNLGGRLGSFDRLEKELAPGAIWSAFDRGIGGGRVLRCRHRKCARGERS